MDPFKCAIFRLTKKYLKILACKASNS